jgi:hypothetical protein
MYCPQCGSNQAEGKRFCTVCGVNLHVITQALTGQLQPVYHPPSHYELERQRETAKGVKLAILGGGFVALKLFGAIFSGASLMSPFSVIGFILLAVGVSKLVAHRPLDQSPVQSAPPPPMPVHQPPAVFTTTPQTSNPGPRPVPSVTEDETRHLPHRTS